MRKRTHQQIEWWLMNNETKANYSTFINFHWHRLNTLTHFPSPNKCSYNFSFALIGIQWLCKCNAFAAGHSRNENNMINSIVSCAVGMKYKRDKMCQEILQHFIEYWLNGSSSVYFHAFKLVSSYKLNWNCPFTIYLHKQIFTA